MKNQFKLSRLAAATQDKKKLNKILGGVSCGCACIKTADLQSEGNSNHAQGKYTEGVLKTSQTQFLDEVTDTAEGNHPGSGVNWNQPVTSTTGNGIKV